MAHDLVAAVPRVAGSYAGEWVGAAEAAAWAAWEVVEVLVLVVESLSRRVASGELRRFWGVHPLLPTVPWENRLSPSDHP